MSAKADSDGPPCTCSRSSRRMSTPSLRNSPWMRGAPQSGLSRLILRISLRTSFDTGGRPGWPRRTFQVQNNRNPLRCQAMTVAGLTMHRAERHSAQAPQNQGVRPGSQAAMPLVFEKQTVWTRAMPITPPSAGIDGECATPTVSARSEFVRATVDSAPTHGEKLICAKNIGIPNS
jgi:hypothetical protein